MKDARVFWPVVALAFIVGGPCTASCSPQSITTGTVPVSMIVSVEAKHGNEVPTVHKQDVRVMHDKDRLQVTDWTPCESTGAGLQLFLLVDETINTDVGLQFNDLKKFIENQPSSTAIGVGYARDGATQIAQNPTNDHARAAQALRLPMGYEAINSIYLSLSDLIKRWPQSTGCREVLLISSGIDFLQPGIQDSYMLDAINQAQRAAIQVYAMYAQALGHAGHSFWLNYWGQYNLSEVTDQTGGEFYIQGLTPPISYGPYLNQYKERLTHQFRLTFLATPTNAGGVQRIQLRTEVPNAELVGQNSIYVPSQR